MGHLGSIPGLGRSPGEGKGYSLQYLDTTEHLTLSLQACYQAATMFHLPGVETESQKMLKGLGKITQQEEREEAALDPCLYHLDHDG